MKGKQFITTECEDCGRQITTKVGASAPQYCSQCYESQWQQKPCAQEGCQNMVSFRSGWQSKPVYCNRCAMAKEQGRVATFCGGCGQVVWSPPSRILGLCPNCLTGFEERVKQNPWQYKPCCNCGKTFKYRQDRETVPDCCHRCREMKKKPCCFPGCTRDVLYRDSWKVIPEYCKEHEKLFKSTHPKYSKAIAHSYLGIDVLLPGTNLTTQQLQGDRNSVLHMRDGSLHVTIFHLRRGTPGWWRLSWNYQPETQAVFGLHLVTDHGLVKFWETNPDAFEELFLKAQSE